MHLNWSKTENAENESSSDQSPTSRYFYWVKKKKKKHTQKKQDFEIQTKQFFFSLSLQKTDFYPV